jgi:hypothetical protein
MLVQQMALNGASRRVVVATLPLIVPCSYPKHGDVHSNDGEANQDMRQSLAGCEVVVNDSDGKGQAVL